MRHWLYRFWLVTLGALLLQTIYYWMRLPAEIASHFDLHGNPDSWSSTTSFIILWLFAIAVINVWPIIVGPLLRKLPPSMINTPNKDFWLSNDRRRDRFISTVRAILGGCIGGANIMLFIAFYETYRFNITGAGEVTIWFGLGIEMAVTTFSVLWGIHALRNPGERAVTSS